MNTFRKTAIALAVTALASSSVGQAESLGYYGYEGSAFNNFGAQNYAAPAYLPNGASNGAPMGYGENSYDQQAYQGYNNGFDSAQQPHQTPYAGFGGPNFGGYDNPGYGGGGSSSYGAPGFDAPPFAANGTPFSGYSNYGPQQMAYGNVPPPNYGNSYAYNQAPNPGFDGSNNWANPQGMSHWNNGPWNNGGPMNSGSGSPDFANYGSGYGFDTMPYGPPPGYAGYGYGQPSAYGFNAPPFNQYGYYEQPYAGFGGPANWGNASGNGWGEAPGNSGWGGAPNTWGNGYEGYNYPPSNNRSHSNGWG